MTKDELKDAVVKFVGYLEANGVHILCHAMYIDEGPAGEICFTGRDEMLIEMMLLTAVHRRGWKVVPK